MVRKVTMVFGALAFAAALLAGVFVLFQNSRASFDMKRQMPDSIKLKTFEGTNPPFDFVFEYPEAWKVKEVQPSEELNMVQVLGPRDPVTKVIPGIFFTVQTAKGKELDPAAIDAALQKEKRFKDFEEFPTKEELIGGAKALHLNFQYVLLLPMWSQNAKDTVLKRSEVYTLRDGKIYRIKLWMTEEQYKIYRPIFDHILKTFKFLD